MAGANPKTQLRHLANKQPKSGKRSEDPHRSIRLTTLNTNLDKMLLEIAERKITGTLHTAGATRISRHEFALKLAEAFNLNTDLIKPAKMDEISWKAKRPRDSSLNVSKALALLNQKPIKLNQALRVMRKKVTAQTIK